MSNIIIDNIYYYLLYREHPVDGEIYGLPDGKQVNEWPNGGCDETDDDHEQEPIGTG